MAAQFLKLGVVFVVLAAAVAWAQDTENEQPEPMTDFRTWTDASGSFTIEAAMVKFVSGKVHLLRRDGTIRPVAIEKLSKEDQKFVRSEVARQKKEARASRGAGSASSGGGGDRAPAADNSGGGGSRAPGADRGEDWPGWLGPHRDGKSPDTGLLTQWPQEGPPLLWKASGIGAGFSSATVVGGLVYVTGNVGSSEVLTALDMQGTRKWQVQYAPAHNCDHPGARSSACYDRGNLYVLSGNGTLACCDATTGQGKWAHRMSEFGGEVPGWGYAESPLIHKDLVIVTPGGDRCIVALDKQSGAPKWSSNGFRAGAQYGSCIAVNHGGAEMIVAGTAEGIVAVDAADGRALWSNPFSAQNTANCPTPACADGLVFWANGYGKGGICLELDVRGRNVTASEAWTTSDMVCHHGGYIIHEGHIYGNHGEGWACLDLRTGERKWQERAVGKGSLCFADGMLYLLGEDGGRAALATCSPDGLEVRGEVTVEGDGPSWAHPVVIGGRLYLRYADNLYCFNVKS